MPRYSTLAELKNALAITGTPTESPDATLNQFLDRADGIIESIVGRRMDDGSKTEKVFADGRSPYLNLRFGPYTAITGIDSVERDDAGSPTYTAEVRGDWILHGEIADQQWFLPSYLEYRGGSVPEGEYRVQGTAGWDFATGIPFTDYPPVISNASIFAATWIWNKRKDAATASRDIGTGSLGGFKDDEKLIGELRTMLAPFIPVRAL